MVFKKSTFINILLILLFYSGTAVLQEKDNFKSILAPNGKVTFARYIYGDKKQSELNPAFRADLVVYMDIFSYRNIIFNFLTSKTTSIGKTSDSPIKLDAIRYSLSPGIRMARRKTVMTLELMHECIHTISRAEENGSIYWNIVRFGMGTKGAYHFYLTDKYITNDITLRNSFDVFAEIGYYLRGDYSEWTGRNHDYNYDMNGLIRYHFEPLNRINMIADFKFKLWLEDNETFISQYFFTLNYVLRARNNIAVIYFRHCIQDDNPHDNFNRLGSIGLKLVF